MGFSLRRTDVAYNHGKKRLSLATDSKAVPRTQACLSKLTWHRCPAITSCAPRTKIFPSLLPARHSRYKARYKPWNRSCSGQVPYSIPLFRPELTFPVCVARPGTRTAAVSRALKLRSSGSGVSRQGYRLDLTPRATSSRAFLLWSSSVPGPSTDRFGIWSDNCPPVPYADPANPTPPHPFFCKNQRLSIAKSCLSASGSRARLNNSPDGSDTSSTP